MEQGLIINSMDFKENSKIVYLLTLNGKKSILVPQSKKIKSSLINETQSITLINYDTVGNGQLPKGINIDVVNYYLNIKNDVKKSLIASYVNEILYKYIAGEDNSDVLYHMIISFFDNLEKREDLKLLLLQLRIKLLYFLGIAPSFKACIHCGKESDLYGLSIRSGGIECKDHITEDNIGSEASKIINLLYYNKSFDITLDNLEVIDYISEVINKYYEIHLESKPKGDILLSQMNLI